MWEVRSWDAYVCKRNRNDHDTCKKELRPDLERQARSLCGDNEEIEYRNCHLTDARIPRLKCIVKCIDD